MQKTNFRFEAIIHDDASTDGTADIIRTYAERYPDIIKPIFESENQYKKYDGSLMHIMDENTHGKYVAICEGDDYWIDPLKLQKQVDFLELHKDYSIVYTGYEVVDFENKRKIVRKPKPVAGNITRELIEKNPIVTATVMYRHKCYDGYKDFLSLFNQKMMFGDLSLWIHLSTKGNVGYIKDLTAARRIAIGSVTNTTTYEAGFPLQKNVEDFLIFANRHLGLGVSEKNIRKSGALCRIRGAMKFSTKTFFRQTAKEIRDYPSLIMSFDLFKYLIASYLIKIRGF